jgi:hypothetical protein
MVADWDCIFRNAGVGGDGRVAMQNAICHTRAVALTKL